jgi:hypothetical protein
LLIIGGAVLLDGLSTAVRQGLEPQASAEERCIGVAPPNGVQSRDWSSCVERKAAEDGVDAALPSILIAMACLLVAASLQFGRAEAWISATLARKPSG